MSMPQVVVFADLATNLPDEVTAKFFHAVLHHCEEGMTLDEAIAHMRDYLGERAREDRPENLNEFNLVLDLMEADTRESIKIARHVVAAVGTE